jgi:hypothetical protein
VAWLDVLTLATIGGRDRMMFLADVWENAALCERRGIVTDATPPFVPLRAAIAAAIAIQVEERNLSFV